PLHSLLGLRSSCSMMSEWSRLPTRHSMSEKFNAMEELRNFIFSIFGVRVEATYPESTILLHGPITTTHENRQVYYVSRINDDVTSGLLMVDGGLQSHLRSRNGRLLITTENLIGPHLGDARR
ncbi:hypothetical protein PENTCL1PPCAC_2826, partial [Pristionchus entomophagus]